MQRGGRGIGNRNAEIIPAVDADGARPAALRKVTAAITGDLPVLSNKVIRAALAFTAPGGAEIEDMITDGLSDLDDQGVLRAKLGEAVPSLENGQWKLLPDGRMETSWRIRDGARWHDGTPLTTADLLFTAMVARDRELTVFRDSTYDLIEGLEAPDQRSITVRWKGPYIQADTMFTRDLALPLPKHLLEKPYAEDKSTFLQHPYWSQEFVGSGPFRVREFARSSHLILEAFDAYPLGRPKIDEIEVRFITDTSTLLANVLAGSVEMTMGRGISMEQALQMRDQWQAGRPLIAPTSWIVIFPQFVGGTPSALTDLTFRRALMHALDREGMAETIQAGLVPVAHLFLNPKDPDFERVQGSALRYDFDVRRAAQLIEGLGFSKGADGAYRDGAGQRLAPQIWTSGGLDIQVKSIFAVADAWTRVGVAAEPTIVAPQRWSDREYVAGFPGFRMNRQGNTLLSLKNYASSQAPMPENNFVGANYARYTNAEFDGLIERYFVTIPTAERTQVLGQIVRYMTEQLPLLYLYYDTQPMLAANRLENLTADITGWNAHAWTMK